MGHSKRKKSHERGRKRSHSKSRERSRKTKKSRERHRSKRSRREEVAVESSSSSVESPQSDSCLSSRDGQRRKHWKGGERQRNTDNKGARRERRNSSSCSEQGRTEDEVGDVENKCVTKKGIGSKSGERHSCIKLERDLRKLERDDKRGDEERYRGEGEERDDRGGEERKWKSKEFKEGRKHKKSKRSRKGRDSESPGQQLQSPSQSLPPSYLTKSSSSTKHNISLDMAVKSESDSKTFVNSVEMLSGNLKMYVTNSYNAMPSTPQLPLRGEKESDRESEESKPLRLMHGRDESHRDSEKQKVYKVSRHKVRKSDGDSEEELMFDWESHRHDLDRMFFGNDDAIRRGSEEHRDFWSFLKKYQGLQKQRRIREMCAGPNGKKGVAEGEEDGAVGTAYDLPRPFDKRYSVNFGLSVVDVEDLRARLPPRDLEDGRKVLSRKKLVEFKLVLLLYLDFMQKQKFEKLKKLRAAQANLPIAAYKEEIVSRVRENSVVIVAGDTGCGKSTQVPQYLLAAGYNNMACTQPRRIACIALAKRVTYETLSEFGSQVGYQIRFEKSRTEHTKIVFVTEGLLLRQASGDNSLGQYDVVILDEVHERHLDTDLLLGVVRVLVRARPDLRVVLMSATINLDLFVKYFQGRAPVVQVPGRLYPITLQYLPIPALDLGSRKKDKLDPGPYMRVLQLVDHKYPPDERGDLLIFLSGVSEIGTVVEAAREYGEQSGRWVVLPLHSTLAVTEQEKVFHIPPEGVRKCIVSTNIAETSVTIDGVRFVVDSGKVKEMSYDAQSKMRRLKEFWISQASAEQRKGRAGRTGPGICFRLYSEDEYTAFPAYSSPEVQRVPLDSLVLRLASMGLSDTRLFPFIEPPPSESLEHALTALKSQDALSPGEALTTLGRLLAQLPVDVSLGKMLIMGSLFHQVEPVLSLAAVMSVQSPFTPRARRDPDCLNMVKELESDHGDPLTLLAAYREWLGVKQEGGQDSRRWCRRRGLEEQRFYETTKLRHQFSRLLHDSGLQDIGGKARGHRTSAERIKRNGQLKQLRELKSQLCKEDGPRRPKVLKLSHGDGGSDEEGTDIKDVDFRIKHDHKQLGEIQRGTRVRSAKDMVILKLVLCSGLYPNLAIADEHNNYKPGSEQLFHTPSKPFAILHPTGVFSAHPEVLQVPDSDIFELPGFTTRHPASPRHQLLAYVSLLETNKVYLVDTLRVPAAQILLLFAQALDTNADMTRVACDAFIELRFPDAASAQNLIFRAVQLRVKWQRLLDLRIEASGTLQGAGVGMKGQDDNGDEGKDWKAEQERQDRQDQVNREAEQLEKDLTAGLVDFYHTETLYSQRRLLQADVSLLHGGPGPMGHCVLAPNPFSGSKQENCQPNDTKGGVDLTDFLTYDCLLETECQVFSITSYDTICPYCDTELHLSTLERLGHMAVCVEDMAQIPEAKEGEEEEDLGHEDDPKKKRYECEVCGRTLRLTIKEIFQHKSSHQQ